MKILSVVFSLILFSLIGCIDNPIPYAPPEACVNTIEKSIIMEATGGNPAMLGKVLKTGVWSQLIARPDQVATVKVILTEAIHIINAETTYFMFFGYLMQELEILDTKYMAPLVIWMPGFDPANQVQLPIGACDKALILKNLTELQEIVNSL